MSKTKSIAETFIRLLPLILILNFFVIIIYYLIQTEAKLLQESLIIIEPIFLVINFSLIIISLLFNLKDLKKILKPIKKNSWIFLLIIFLLGFVLRMSVAPHTHRVFFDEDIYLDIGKEILTEGKGCLCNYGDRKGCYDCILMKWPNGYPFTLAVAYMFFGISESVAFNLTVLLGSLSVILIFLMGYLLTKKEEIGLFSALLFALIPVHIIWSGTTASEPVFVFYTLLAVFALSLSLKSNTWKSNLFAMSSLAFACQIKAESGIILALIAVFMLLLDKKLRIRINDHKFLIPLIILLVLITPYIVHMIHSARTDPWGAKGKKFGLEYAEDNIPTNAWFWIMGYSTIEHPILFTILAIIGLIFTIITQRRLALVLGFWFLMFFFVYAFFYAGSVRYGTDVRYSLSGYPPLILLAGFGLYFIYLIFMKKIKKRILALLALLAMIFVMIYISFYIQNCWTTISTPAEEIMEANQARTYHDFVVREAREFDKDCYILSHTPSIFLIMDLGSLQSWYGQNTAKMRELFNKTDCVIFDDNYWCNLEPYKSSVCKHMFDAYELTLLSSVEAGEGRHTYALYKISNPYE